MSFDEYPTIESTIGQTPLVRLQRMLKNPYSVVLAKLEGNNPAGSVKDRPAMSMIREAEARGRIKPGDTIIEAGDTVIIFVARGKVAQVEKLLSVRLDFF